MYAVIKTGGKQYRVAADDVIKVEKVTGEVGETIAFTDVLMVGGEGSPQVGTPLVDGATVAGEVVEQGRAKKIIVFKMKRRKGYRRKKGHRQKLTTVKITDILTGGKKASKTGAAKKPDDKAAKVVAKSAGSSKESAAAGGEIQALFSPPKGPGDDLTQIKGVGPVLEEKLNKLGITKFEQIAAFSEDDCEKVDTVLNFKGRIEREDWIGQAKKFGEEN